MKTSNVIYQGDLRTICTHNKSGTRINTDAPTDNQGKGESFSPTDMLATSVAACMLTIMGIKARDRNIDLKDVKVEVQKTMATNPRRVQRVDLQFVFPESLKNLDKKDIILLKNAAATCPVAKSLHPDIEIAIDWSKWK